MDPIFEYNLHQTRRQFFGHTGLRLGGLALGMLAGNQAPGPRPAAGPGPGASAAARVAALSAQGEVADLSAHERRPGPDGPVGLQAAARTLFQSGTARQRPPRPAHHHHDQRPGRFPVAPSKFKFTRHGQCGTWVSELLPHTAQHVDDMAVIKSVHTNAINHDPACTYVMTGSEVPGKASIGSWLAYGLGSESNDLPAFVVLTPRFPASGNGQALFTRMWSSGFLPTRFNGVALRGTGDPVLYVQNPPGVTDEDRRTMLNALGELNQRNFERLGDPETQTRIAQYEMAFRMQTSVPDLVNIASEPQRVLDMYGPAVREPGSFAHSALLARRLIERGVRVVQILHRGWDQHGNLPVGLKNQCDDTDRGTGALLADLKQRGLAR